MKEAREALKNRFSKSQTQGARRMTQTDASSSPTKANTSSGKEMRSWVGVSDKVSAKTMEQIDVSLNKGGEIDIDR